jgi:CHASE2 domain-containing sensor protein
MKLMRKLFPLILIILFMYGGCHSPKESIITIINIGHTDRPQLGKQLWIIKKYSPRIIAFDFHLVPDSLDRDTILVNELKTARNTVQIVSLHELNEPDHIWDSLEVSHLKFRIAHHGFSNLAVMDSVLIRELPMKQTFGSKPIHSFSYVIAENCFGVRDKFKDKGEEEIEFDLDELGANYKLINAVDLLSGNFKEQDLMNKIVMLGYIGHEEDYFYLDRARTRKVNGVEVHAAIVDELIRP